MAWSLIAQASGTGSVTLDTTGADLIVLSPVDFNTNLAISENKGNTGSFNYLTTRTNANTSVRIAYCYNPTVGSGHTFSAFNSYAGISVVAYSGAAASPFDQENGAGVNGTSLATGSITPTENNELILAFIGLGGNGLNPSIGSGFTLDSSVNAVSGVRYGNGVAHLEQTTAAAINPAWSWTNSSETAVAIASFKAAASGTTINADLGAATASGFTAGINLNRTIAASLGTAAAAGYTVTINLNKTVSTFLGTAVADGFLASIGLSTTVAAALGTAAALGHDAFISNGTVISANLGVATAAGFDATIGQSTSIAAGLGTAVASGFDATIDNGYGYVEVYVWRRTA